jgi:hypothetical protein
LRLGNEPRKVQEILVNRAGKRSFGDYAAGLLEQRRYLELKAYFCDVAVHRTSEKLEEEFRRVPFEPYAPVRGQLHCILREVNRRRKLAQYEALSGPCIRMRRRVVKPFGERDVPTGLDSAIKAVA